MIITNFLAKWIVGLAAKFTPGTVGVTIFPFIFIYPPKYKSETRLIKHERTHIKQYLNYWPAGRIVLAVISVFVAIITTFFPVYLYQYIKDGYQKMDIEEEARKLE